MRLCSLLLILPHLLLSASNEYYGELFGTSDFALLTQQNCARFIETDVGKGVGQCPLGLSEADNLDAFDHQCVNVDADTVRSHLVRDVYRKNKPRILFVYLNSKTHEINYGIETLSLIGNHSQWSVPGTLKESAFTGFQLQPHESLADSIFDTQSNLLYLIIKAANSKTRMVRVVYVGNIFTGRTFFQEFDRKFSLHAHNLERFDWVENPYEHMVYYMKYNVLYRLQMSEILPSLIDGKEGEYLFEFPDPQRTLIWAHNGAMITLGRNKEDRGLVDEYYLRNATAHNSYSRGRRCSIIEHDGRYGRKTRRLITLFDWDYCMLAHGGDGTKTADGRVCPIYYNELAVIENTGSGDTLYIVALVLMFVFIVLLLVYVCWLRSQDDALPRDEHKPVPYYPSGQPLDSTFDMSVDRWDQY